MSLLLVAAGQRADRRRLARDPHADLAEHARHGPPLGPAPDQAEVAELSQAGQAHVLPDRAPEHEALLLARLGNHGHPGAQRRPRPRAGQRDARRRSPTPRSPAAPGIARGPARCGRSRPGRPARRSPRPGRRATRRARRGAQAARSTARPAPPPGPAAGPGTSRPGTGPASSSAWSPRSRCAAAPCGPARPSRRIVTWSASSATSRRKCDTSTTVVPPAASRADDLVQPARRRAGRGQPSARPSRSAGRPGTARAGSPPSADPPSAGCAAAGRR